MDLEDMFKPLRRWFRAHRNTKPSRAPVAAPPPPRASDASADDASDTPVDLGYPRPALPRLYINGRFYNDPPTINNLVGYYDTDRFRPSYQLTTDEINFNGAFCPKGTGTFAFVDCAVEARYSPTHGVSTDATDEALIGQTIAYNGRSVYGKLVDLDPQFQDVFTLYGARVIVGEGNESFSALLLPAPSRDFWDAIYNPDSDGKAYNKGAAATFQGILKLEEAVKPGTSTFLSECKDYLDATMQFQDEKGNYPYPNGALSIRFRTDSYSNDYTAPDFCYGNLTAYITPWLPGFPASFDAARLLAPTSDALVTRTGDTDTTQVANRAVARVEAMPTNSQPKYTLFVDFCNALYRTQARGKMVDGKWQSALYDQGDLTVVYAKDGSFQQIGSVKYRSQQFEQTSCVANFSITDSQYNDLLTSPLSIQNEDGNTPIAEAIDGIFASADTYLYRLQPDGTEQTAKVYVSKFGVLQQGHTVHVGIDSSLMQTNGQRQGGGPDVGTPLKVLTVCGKAVTGEDFVCTSTTGETGSAPITISGTDLQVPRGYIDGQVYGLSYSATTSPPPKGTQVIGNDKINLLLFSNYVKPQEEEEPRDASWVVDILPIFQQYANLYPSMDRVVRLDDYSSVLSRKNALLRVFTAPEDSGEYMPTKRDLSAKKKDVIIKWLQSGAPYMNTTKKDLFAALQAAVQVELSTMPPYLTALYSIKPGYNTYIAKTLREVAMEEMLHMAISCNILISIGGNPTLNTMGIVPKYPGPLPGGVCEDLIVGLRKCTKQQIRVFQRIESPDNVYITEDGVATTDDNYDSNKVTIGTIYSSIADALTSLYNDQKIFFPKDLQTTNPDQYKKQYNNQVTGPFGDKLKRINELQDALDLIQIIKDQGEGKEEVATDANNQEFIDPTDNGSELAHYFRFAEIVRGRRLTFEKDGDGKVTEYAFNGPPIVLNPEGVYNMQDDPKIELQPLGSQQRDRMNSFARKYEALLKGLHQAFNGDPDYFEKCYGLMFQLTMAAQPLMEMPALDEEGKPKADGTTCGISFQMPIDEMITYHVPKAEDKPAETRPARTPGCA